MDMTKLFGIKKRYNDLIETRIDDMKLPDKLRTMTTRDFVKIEDAIDREATKEKDRLGILAKTRVSFCEECCFVFKRKTKKDVSLKCRGKEHQKHKEIDFHNCIEHKGLSGVHIQHA